MIAIIWFLKRPEIWCYIIVGKHNQTQDIFSPFKFNSFSFYVGVNLQFHWVSRSPEIVSTYPAHNVSNLHIAWHEGHKSVAVTFCKARDKSKYHSQASLHNPSLCVNTIAACREIPEVILSLPSREIQLCDRSSSQWILHSGNVPLMKPNTNVFRRWRCHSVDRRNQWWISKNWINENNTMSRTWQMEHN